ncbi:hypothetical protein [Pyrobaculum calidifontis]|uniref:hypothetical protein n=1 Tax=Pyrobaculum calidifontis TaxID=181486 RepID=UPI000325E306|nr:hypothetical protein [Pyrobaculum calidifontis]
MYQRGVLDRGDLVQAREKIYKAVRVNALANGLLEAVKRGLWLAGQSSATVYMWRGTPRSRKLAPLGRR